MFNPLDSTCAPLAFPYLCRHNWNGHPCALFSCFQGVSCPHNCTPFSCQPCPLPRSHVGLPSHFPIAAPLTSLLTRMLFPSVFRWILSPSSIPWSIEEPMVIKGNMLLTPAVQLSLGPQNCSLLPRTFPFFSRTKKKTPPKLLVSLITPSSTMQSCLMCSRSLLDRSLVYMWKSRRPSLSSLTAAP